MCRVRAQEGICVPEKNGRKVARKRKRRCEPGCRRACDVLVRAAVLRLRLSTRCDVATKLLKGALHCTALPSTYLSGSRPAGDSDRYVRFHRKARRSNANTQQLCMYCMVWLLISERWQPQRDFRRVSLL